MAYNPVFSPIYAVNMAVDDANQRLKTRSTDAIRPGIS
jgi:hypothetical protein